ncbi:hypothetical protein IID10_01910 [candidate division KSB1 bacterium]|nr:hypothetical protein [candidate division KSB1 bacterium]
MRRLRFSRKTNVRGIGGSKKLTDPTGLCTVVYVEPTYEKTDCIPGFYYQPECGCESVKWLAIIPHYKEIVGEIGVEGRGNNKLIRMSTQSPSLLYRVTPDGQFHDVVATHVWLEKYQTSHTPALIMMRVTETEITKEIIPTCDDGETHFDIVYTQDELKDLMTLLDISIPLENYVPRYEFNGQPITNIDE